MNGEVYSIFMELVKELVNWQKDFRQLGEDFDITINKLNVYLRHNTHVEPINNIRELITCLKDKTLDELGFYLSEDEKTVSIIDESGRVAGIVVSWYENALHKDDVDQDLVRQFLMGCRKEFKETENEVIAEMYSEVRHFINPSNYLIRAENIMEIISKYSDISETIMMIKEWYENVSFSETELVICPTCGKTLSNDIFEEFKCTDMCMYYRDKDSLDLKKLKLDNNRKYKKLKRGIYTYTLLPGISELRLYEILKSKYANNNVILYPEIDKFDIGISYESGHIYVDVKDFISPYHLIDTLIENHSFIKMGNVKEEDYVYLVIPNHRRHLYEGGDYKRILKQRIGKLSSKISICYEDEFLREVGNLVNEI